MTRQFVDTNVLVYAYDTGAGDRHEIARQLVGDLGDSQAGAISVQVLQEFYVTLSRKAAVPVPPAEARRHLLALSRWAVHAPTPSDVIAAAEAAEQHQLSFWDAMILRSARQLGCSTLWTEGLNSGQVIDGVEVANPFRPRG
ncbi:MAG: PIN domain-containing protein [Propionibacteriaceae bacterium]|nr:PIN domain-containing protein [Propionibacteriaceae bacterium]